MEEPAQAVEPFIRALRNAKVAPNDLTSITTALSALIAVCDKHQLDRVTLATASTPFGCIRYVLTVDTTILPSKSPAKT